ncbi:TPA: hypothetical protein ACWLU8_001303 [Morganella morganii]|uniref:hypothetical protein n=1 Tax=Morganella sp. Je.2.23 TaxID=3142840 RepID=UPI003DA99EB8
MIKKRVTDDMILLDVEKINGYLCAVESINCAPNVAADYQCLLLDEKVTLLESVQDGIICGEDKYPVEYWHISLQQTDLESLKQAVRSWFFRLGHAENLADKLDDLAVGFIDLIQPYTYGAAIYRVEMAPPVWYAIGWEIFVVHTKYGALLFRFSFDG